ncbi:MAG: ATP-binding protein, partial [Spirochaetia bacterium]|nr:ATP-binding protein [Spirochaetia bacterium]
MLDRLLAETLRSSPKSILLLGPRQVGKSTLLKSLKPDLKINLSLESEYMRFLSQAERLPSLIMGQKPKTVFIDEIQRIPSLLNTIQAIIDDFSNPPKFYLSGSSARKLKRGNANLLPGRIFIYHLSGLCITELQDRMDPYRAMSLGLLPEPFLSENQKFAEKLLRDYSASYLVEEIQSEALTRDLQGFSRFLKVLGAMSGNILDYSKISNMSNVSRTSVIRFIEILEDTLIAERIYCYPHTNAEIVKHPKLFFFDTGVLNGLLGNFGISEDRVGNLFEHLVYAVLKNSIYANDIQGEIYFFRTRNGLEVDFLLVIKNKLYAIEVKAGSVFESDTKALIALQKYCPNLEKSFIVSPKESQQRKIGSIIICGI